MYKEQTTFLHGPAAKHVPFLFFFHTLGLYVFLLAMFLFWHATGELFFSVAEGPPHGEGHIGQNVFVSLGVHMTPTVLFYNLAVPAQQ